MVLVGGGLLLPWVWSLNAAAPSAGTIVLLKPATGDPSVAHRSPDQEPTPESGPAWMDIAPFSFPAVVEADPAANPESAAGMLIAYTWTGNNGTAWDNSGNWSSAGGGYPDDCGDDATIPSGTWDITLVALQIDDLEVSGSVDFDGSAQSPPVLKADSITLSGSGAITLTFTSTCTLKTFGCP
ncbi:MAG: hypothetical protein IT449_18150 [Phycisphaerales bacterium]|nr:hypothetical protein [Phycisphaerales bacterium]